MVETCAYPSATRIAVLGCTGEFGRCPGHFVGGRWRCQRCVSVAVPRRRCDHCLVRRSLARSPGYGAGLSGTGLLLRVTAKLRAAGRRAEEVGIIRWVRAKLPDVDVDARGGGSHDTTTGKARIAGGQIRSRCSRTLPITANEARDSARTAAHQRHARTGLEFSYCLLGADRGYE